MLTTRELQDEIIHLKKEKDICILAHAYQSHDIWEVADYVGDSYGLSVQAAKQLLFIQPLLSGLFVVRSQ